MNSDRKGNCKLCKEERPLRKSHILPEFFYDDLYDANHQIAVATEAHGGRVDHISKGRWERLLCEDCESFLNTSYESYASGVYKRHLMPDLKEVASSGYITLTGLDYMRFKLFLLSLIWRLGVTRDKIGEMVELGPHEEVLRRKLLEKDPGKPHEYGVIMVGGILNGRVLHDGIIPAVKNRVEGENAYSIFISGIAYSFIVSKRSHLISEKSLFLTEDGTQVVPTMDVTKIPFISDSIYAIKPIVDKHLASSAH